MSSHYHVTTGCRIGIKLQIGIDMTSNNEQVGTCDKQNNDCRKYHPKRDEGWPRKYGGCTERHPLYETEFEEMSSE
jgi:hypothetical protein